MIGCRPLTESEIEMVSNSFGGRYGLRNRAIFLTGIYTGFRISELLSLTYKDVHTEHEVRSRVALSRRHMKGKREGRKVVLHEKVRDALKCWIDSAEWYPDKKLFHSQKGGAINRQQAHNILKEAYNSCELDGILATHTMRKTFAHKLYEISGGNIIKVKKALGHQKVTTTQNYLDVDEKEIETDILSM